MKRGKKQMKFHRSTKILLGRSIKDFCIFFFIFINLRLLGNPSEIDPDLEDF
ncbi:hypothetical protein HanPSC8_Chr14g0627981 [Helianthus annuus]|nr:hypothetical protein HanPSC8_Chr14g0627981 [Helianthus annuus]